MQPTTPQLDAVKFWEDNATTRWNRRATELFGTTTLPNGQAAASRILTYLSIAQHRAALAAEASKDGSTHPSVSVAIGAASVVVLSQFYPLSAATLETQFDADLAAQGWPGRKNQDATSGEAVGRAVGAAVLAQAATDNYLAVVPPTQPPGPGKWAPMPNPVRSLFGVRPFFLTSADQIRPGPPPAFGSAEYLAALAEIRGISDTRTTEQVSIAQTWAFGAAPFTAGAENLIADQLIAEHHRNEKDAARILAYAKRRGVRRADRVLGREVLLLFHSTDAGRPGDHGGGPASEPPVLSIGPCMHHGRDHVRADGRVPERARSAGGDHRDRRAVPDVRWHPLPLRYRCWRRHRSSGCCARVGGVARVDGTTNADHADGASRRRGTR